MCQSQIKSKLELTCRAGEMFYGKNKFLIWWHGLGDFLSGVSTDTKANGSVELIVRNVTVRYDMNEDKKNWRGKKLATELERLFCLENANSVRIEIIGGGSFEGSDIKSQLLLKDICPIVKRLIDHFGDRFKIDKGCGGFGLCPMRCFWPLKKYWDAPDDSIREKVNTGTASFEEHMRVQVEAWLSEGSPSEISLCSDKFPAALWQTHEPFLEDTEWLLQQLHGIVQEADSTEWEMLL
ncbi:hypothetical protein THAR02_11321 [Trichoderma harzianum]|uniref:Uncharacterized protein n=1 Tax=Trichoderma harzianum TaxID=5544 RepID=A0A0F9WTV3_TRIHA|nr:hypothetical protein THAR02_11321 [Trichoderma harzianum]